MTKARFTSDVEHRKTMLQALEENGRYCPCSIEKNADTKCMCKDFRDQIKSGKLTTCHCGLYETYED